MRRVAILLAATLLLLTGCGARPAATEPAGGEATLYIGMEGRFREYPLSYSGELTPEKLIAGIAERTGWNLDLADEVTDGKGGMSVCFSERSALFVGPPEPQREEFSVYSADELAAMILDSIQRTLQYNFVNPALGDPSALPIYYCGPDGGALSLSNIGITLPLETPYRGLVSGDTRREGVFLGLSEGIARVNVDGTEQRFAVEDSEALWTLRALEPGSPLLFEIERDKEGAEKIVRIYGD